MADCKPAATPAEKGLPLSQETNASYTEPDFPYRQAIGSLIYLMVGTRPDISWIVSKLSQYLDRPNASHIAAVKLLFRYIEGTIDYTIPWSPTNRHLVMLALIGTVMQTTDT